MAALEEEFTLSAVPLGAGPDGLLGVEQCDKTDQFLVTDSGRTVILYKVRPVAPHPLGGAVSPIAERGALGLTASGGENGRAGLAESHRGPSGMLTEG